MAVKTKQAKASSSKAKSKPKFSKETYVKWYKDMLLIRKFEEKTGQLYIQQKFGGFCHLYIGQEAIVAGTASACKKDDKHMTAYRDHGHPIALGTDPRVLMAELYGRITGCSKGKGGSMHFFDKEKNFMGGHGIVVRSRLSDLPSTVPRRARLGSSEVCPRLGASIEKTMISGIVDKTVEMRVSIDAAMIVTRESPSTIFGLE